MNILIFNFFFSLSTDPVIAGLSLFISNVLIYFFIIIAILIPIFVNRNFIYSIITFGTGAFSWIIVYIIKNIY